ncbi:ABC transporter ATP-binding protein [Chitinispirillales bacterium ANBcel5]|uniref:ABC transporter ATP-binding protein n=1 Tax=Cellulosispirillum alkaliphilum TaxID=3039283 RepID=UPI002A5483DD|nr:ABC transporter ATP-binding protein [Chitinispirillales bacterium ANBcel5]
MLIELKNVSKSYLMGTTVVAAAKSIDLSIAKNEYISIMGPSGSGKSTLMNILGFLDRPDSGDYLFEGESVLGMNDDQWAELRNRAIGFVFQTFNLLPNETAINNVELPMLYAGVSIKSRKEIARQTLLRVGLSHRLMHRPSEMSGGERQRVAIARALVNDPSVILADEPTGNLDSSTGAEIMTIFKELFKAGKTIILVTHDLDVGLHANRLVRIRDGAIEGDEEVKR